MRLFPESAYIQLEFDKVKSLLSAHCRSEYAIEKANKLRIHTRIEFIETELRQSFEYKQLLQNSIYFPNDPVFNLLKLESWQN
jgi:DNA mismatch repair protein MutS2